MDATEDRLLDGRVRLRQPRDGYRAGLDAALLAAACDAGPGDRVAEAGCGPGAVLLAAATRRQGAHFLGLENDPVALAFALENIELNGLDGRVAALNADVTQPFSRLGLQPFDAVLSNPPFFDDPNALRGPSPAKRAAWIAAEGLGVWCAFLIKAVREKGTITLIHRADRLADIMAELAPKAGSFAVRPIHPFADARPSACWCGRSRREELLSASCRRWSCTTAAAPSTRRPPRRSCGARRRSVGRETSFNIYTFVDTEEARDRSQIVQEWRQSGGSPPESVSF